MRGSAGSAVVVGIILAWFNELRMVIPLTKGGVKNASAAIKTLRGAQWLESNIFSQVPGYIEGPKTLLHNRNPVLLLLADQW